VNSQVLAVPTDLSLKSKASMVTTGMGIIVSVGMILRSKVLSSLLLKIAR